MKYELPSYPCTRIDTRPNFCFACIDSEETVSSFAHKSSTFLAICRISRAKAIGRIAGKVSLYNYWPKPPTFPEPSAQRQVTVVAAIASNLAIVASFLSAKPNSDEVTTEEKRIHKLM